MYFRTRFSPGWLPDLPDRRDKTFSKALLHKEAAADQAVSNVVAATRVPGETGRSSLRTFHGWHRSHKVAAAAFSSAEEQNLASPLLDSPPHESSLPSSIDLRQYMSPVEDQGSVGSCTANAVIGLSEYLQIATRQEYVESSRLFLYKVTRNLMQQRGDTGAYIRETIKALRLFGTCPETYYPYVDTAFDNEPDAFCYSFATNYRAISYYRLENLIEIKRSLAQGYPVAFGFTCYESLELPLTAKTGYIPYPKSKEKVVGGHAVLAVGYIDGPIPSVPKDTGGAIIIRNSWGKEWGVGGYGLLPYAYFHGSTGPLPLADDYWTMTQLEIPDLSIARAAPFLFAQPVFGGGDGRGSVWP